MADGLGRGKSERIVRLFEEALLDNSTELQIPENVPDHQTEQEKTRENKERVGKKVPKGLQVDGAPCAKPLAQYFVNLRAPHILLPL